MRPPYAILFAGLAPACVFHQDQDSFDVTEPITAIDLTSTNGDVTVRGGAGDDVHVVVDLQWVNERPKVDWDVQDGVLILEAWCDHPSWLCVTDLTLDVPRDIAADLRTTTGDVLVRDLDGDVDLRGTTGNATFTDIGGAVGIDITTGRVDGDGLQGPTVDVTVTTGDIDLLHEADFTRMTAITTTGNIRLLVPSGTYDCTADNTTGNIEITGLVDDPDAAAEITATTTTGNIEITGYAVTP